MDPFRGIGLKLASVIGAGVAIILRERALGLSAARRKKEGAL